MLSVGTTSLVGCASLGGGEGGSSSYSERMKMRCNPSDESTVDGRCGRQCWDTVGRHVLFAFGLYDARLLRLRTDNDYRYGVLVATTEVVGRYPYRTVLGVMMNRRTEWPSRRRATSPLTPTSRL
eukprot:COSAG01_NODE_2185_length_8205_cov_92.522576_2_plen_125_part_00